MLGPEFLLLAQCCQWNFRNSDHARPEPRNDLDWDLAVRLARRHRVEGLVWNALARVEPLPRHVRETLSSAARSIAATNLAIATECSALLKAFQQAEIELLFVKGLTVGALAYRSPLLKMGWDIDLLIDLPDLERASKLLHSLGYALRIPGNKAALAPWHAHNKESVWHRDDSFHVELHTRLADNSKLIPRMDARSPRQWVDVMPTIKLPTIGEDELIAYLSVHGASSAWFRLKWISDFGALLAWRNGEELQRLYVRSQQLGAARAFGQALMLADLLFGVLKPAPELRKFLAKDRATRLLCRTAIQMMTGGDGEPTERPLGTLHIHWTQFLLRPDLSFKLSELRRQIGVLTRRQ